MKHLFILSATTLATAAAATPYSQYDLAFPVLQRRGSIVKGGGIKTVEKKMKISLNAGKSRPDSPPRDGDTHVFGKVVGPGKVSTRRRKHHPEADLTHLGPGESREKSTHDSHWSLVEAQTDGVPPSNAARQDPRLHPTKVEGTGRSGMVEVTAPERGGYAKITKEVHGQVVEDRRVPSGQTASIPHAGSQPGEVKFTASSSRGGSARVRVHNFAGESDGDPVIP